jgi:hypothetical protein
MNYTVASDNFEAKKFGETVTEKELLEIGVNIKALIAGGHLSSGKATPTTATQGE